MADIPQITVKSVIACDDIRREDNGKEILIGVYSAGIIVQQLPAPLSLAFWIQFRGNGTGELSLAFRLMGGEDVKFAEIKATMDLARAGLGSMRIGPIPVVLQVLTPLTLQMKQAGQDWITIEEISIEKGLNPLTGKPGAIAEGPG